MALIAALLLIALLVAVILAVIASRGMLARMTPLEQHVRALNQSMTGLNAAQHQLSGALSHVAETQTIAQSQTLRVVEERLEYVSLRMGDSLGGAAQATARSIGELRERLDGIDRAQATIERLSGDVLGLQDILSNKQTRGQFGEFQLEDILRQTLAPGSYRLQPTLSNGRRPDCLIELPGPPGPLAVDSKFPLEAYQRLLTARRAAREPGAKRLETEAARAFRTDLQRHIEDIAARYILPGETAESALMFLPSEAVYAEIHAHFPEIARAGFGRRVWIVSPTTMMAVLTTMRAALRDHEIHRNAAAIRRELSLLGDDMERLGTRVGNLRTHFAQAEQDLSAIDTSAGKALRRARRIGAAEFGETQAIPRSVKTG